jgi:ATP adenylyltransferase/5',5'''-P-1,P-4-tetraphosphate phosphorylase II
MSSYINFNNNLAKRKPNTLKNKQISCPFCAQETLRKENGILHETTDILWIKNKFPTFEHAFQTVVVEHNQCDYNLSNYSKTHLYRLMNFVFSNWLEMEKDTAYESVILMKNHGLQSGASIHHSHMQIIGFENIDYKEYIQPSDFEGTSIIEGDVSLNLSSFPKSEMYEFNLFLPDTYTSEQLHTFSDLLQGTVRYILTELNKKHESFNLMFYHLENKIMVKIVPRSPSSAFLIGYHLHQVPLHTEDVITTLKQTYLS